MKTIHRYYQDLIAIIIGSIVVLGIATPLGAIDTSTSFWLTVILTLMIVSVGVVIKYVVIPKKEKPPPKTLRTLN